MISILIQLPDTDPLGLGAPSPLGGQPPLFVETRDLQSRWAWLPWTRASIQSGSLDQRRRALALWGEGRHDPDALARVRNVIVATNPVTHEKGTLVGSHFSSDGSGWNLESRWGRVHYRRDPAVASRLPVATGLSVEQQEDAQLVWSLAVLCCARHGGRDYRVLVVDAEGIEIASVAPAAL